MYQRLGKIIQFHRKEMGYTASDLALKLNTSMRRINNLEQGFDCIKLNKLPEVSRVIKAPLAELIEAHMEGQMIRAEIKGYRITLEKKKGSK